MADFGEELALQACTSCYQKKRKCSKELPACELCRRNRRRCDYPLISSPATQSSGTPSSQERNPFPTLFFLDLYTFNRRRSIIPKPQYGLPDRYYKCLGSQEDLRRIVDTYFSTIHPLFPIVSKLRIYKQLSRPPDPLDIDSVVLFTAMWMHCMPKKDYEPATTDAYILAKQCFSYAEENNIFTLKLLQSALLIAMYEIGNAIYPAAYLTAGYCARLGYCMGIHDRKRGPQMFPVPASWAESEERRRVWWAIIILDRYVNLGGGNRPFACRDAKSDDLLPMDEFSWEKGEFIVIQPLVVSEYTAIRSSPFARTCQSSHLLSHVLRHLNEEYTDIRFHYQEAMQLHRTISAFKTALSNDIKQTGAGDNIPLHVDPSLFSAMGICSSSQLTLYDAYLCVDADNFSGVGLPEQVEMQQIAISSLRETLQAVHELVILISRTTNNEADDLLLVSPLTMDCLYQAALLIASYIQETGNTEHNNMMRDTVNVLQMLGRRWHVANEYVKALDISSAS